MTQADPRSLAGYLETIRDRPAELRTVSRQTDPNRFEVTALLENLELRKQFSAVLFHNPLNLLGEPSQFKLLANLWATRERCAEMLGLCPDQAGRELGVAYAKRLEGMVEPVVVPSDDAPVQAHVYQGGAADLRMFPVVRHFEKDVGPVMTMAHIMRAPSADFYNVTFAKTFLDGGQRGGLTIHTPDLRRMLGEWERRGEPFPVVNVLGHHPAFWLGSLALTPYGTNEYDSIGGFLDEPLRLTPSVTWGKDFLVPADAEIVIEGEIVPGERMTVNPFGEVSRLYQSEQQAPVMAVKAITHRPGAIMQDVFSGHREHWLLGLIPREGSLYNHLQASLGNVVAVHLPFSGCGRFTCYISIKKTGEGQPKLVALQALAQAPMLQTIVVVDEDIDVFNEEDVLWALNVYVDPSRDVDLIKNIGRPSDHRALGAGRLLIDATRPTHVPFPERLRVPPSAVAAIDPEAWLDP